MEKTIDLALKRDMPTCYGNTPNPTVEARPIADVPKEVSTEEATKTLGQSKDTVLKLRAAGLLQYRNAVPPGSIRTVYRFLLESVLKLRTNYDTDDL